MEFLVNLDVDDLAKAIGFYSDALGLKVGRSFGAFGAEMLGSSAPLYLLVKATDIPASSTMPQSRTYKRHWTPVHLDFVVQDIEPAVLRALSAGAQLEDAIETHRWGRIARMADPFGHGFCLIQFLERGYDEIAQSGAPPDVIPAQD